jgi:phosphatidate cytidylyltransferase
MTFNWQTFKTRTVTAIIFAAVMLVGLLWNHWSFFILFSIIHFGCWWEYLKLVEKIQQVKFHNYLKFGLMMIGYGLVLWFGLSLIDSLFWQFELDFDWEILSLSVIPISGFIFLVIGYSKTNDISSKSFWPVTIGAIYISLSFGLLIHLYSYLLFSDLAPNFFEFHWSIPVIIIFSLWINDTMAYIIGSLIGKTSLSKVSPKKTWEGTIGGIILTIAVAFLIARLIHLDFVRTAIIAAITSIAGTFGDLFESKLKRMAGVKDSGHIMPGHGGFLDRFDSLLFAIPFVWLYVYLFMR